MQVTEYTLHKVLLLTTLGMTIFLSACASAPLSALPSTPTAAPTKTRTPVTATVPPSVFPTAGGIPILLETLTPTDAATSSPADWPTGTPTALPTSTAAPTATRVPTATAAPTSTPNLPVINLNACAMIWESAYYKLTANIKTTGFDCFYIQGNNVVFDCDNHSIEGNNFAGYGFFVRKYGFPFQQTPTNVEIKNCKIFNHRTGIFVGGGNNIYIHHNDLSKNLDTVDQQRFGIFLGMTEGGGLRLDTVQNGRVEYNTTNHEAIGIDVRDSDHVFVRHNTASSNSAWGISLLNTSYSEVTNNTVRDNIRYCAWGDGTVGRGCDAGGIILQDGASHDLVAENDVSGENGNGVFIKAHASRCGDYNRIERNKIVDAVYNAIEFSFCTGNQVIGNEITGSYDAVWFGFSSNTEVRKNIIRNMNNHGIISFNSRDSLIAENEIVNSREGIFFYWEKWDAKRFFFLTPTPDNYASRDNVIRNNTLRDNTVAAIHLANSTGNRMADNIFERNGKTVWLEGTTDGSDTGTKP